MSQQDIETLRSQSEQAQSNQELLRDIVRAMGTMGSEITSLRERVTALEETAGG